MYNQWEEEGGHGEAVKSTRCIRGRRTWRSSEIYKRYQKENTAEGGIKKRMLAFWKKYVPQRKVRTKFLMTLTGFMSNLGNLGEIHIPNGARDKILANCCKQRHRVLVIDTSLTTTSDVICTYEDWTA